MEKNLVNEFVINYSGDNPPHDIWNESLSSQVQATKMVVDHLANKISGIRIFPAMGNHGMWSLIATIMHMTGCVWHDHYICSCRVLARE